MPIPRGVQPKIPSGPEYDYAGPSSPAPRPSRAADGTLIFEGRWKDVFLPNVTPEEMFSGGAFAGAFFWCAPIPTCSPIATGKLKDKRYVFTNTEGAAAIDRRYCRAALSAPRPETTVAQRQPGWRSEPVQSPRGTVVERVGESRVDLA